MVDYDRRPQVGGHFYAQSGQSLNGYCRDQRSAFAGSGCVGTCVLFKIPEQTRGLH